MMAIHKLVCYCIFLSNFKSDNEITKKNVNHHRLNAQSKYGIFSLGNILWYQMECRGIQIKLRVTMSDDAYEYYYHN